MNNPTSVLGRTVSTTKRRACALALILVFSAVGVGGVPSREAGAQESPLMGAADTTTVEVEAAPTETIAPNTATVLPEPYADGWNDDKARVTIQAYFKVR
jgi:hypothetical protein